MSSEKKVASWRSGKFTWKGRLYLSPEVMASIRKRAKDDDRDVGVFMSKTLEKIFSNGNKP